MLVYAGIDEAGYGPMLGPLCVACAAFVVRDHEPAEGAPNLWALLRGCVCRGRRDSKRRIAVDDSKKLKGANAAAAKCHPLAHLERGVLAFARQAWGALPESDEQLCAHLGVQIAGSPWYGSITDLPLAHRSDMLGIAAARLDRGLAKAGVEMPLLACEAIDAAKFNEAVQRTGSKSTVNFEAAMRLLDAVRRRWPGAHPRVVIDRQGGRTHYREELALAFPETSITILAEAPALSRYRLDDPATGPLTVTFTPDSERRHLPAALASMTAKYVRELLMLRLNRFFAQRLPELRPTAGYVQDGRRFVSEIEPVIAELGLPRQSLIRVV